MLLVVGAKAPLHLDLGQLERRMRRPPLREELEKIGTATPGALLALYLAGPEQLWRWVESVPPVTDDHTRVDFSSPRLPQAGYGFGTLRVFEPFQGIRLHSERHLLDMQRLFQRLREPVTMLLDGAPGSELVEAQVEAERRRHDAAVELTAKAISARGGL
jgi:hypothetical protein